MIYWTIHIPVSLADSIDFLLQGHMIKLNLCKWALLTLKYPQVPSNGTTLQHLFFARSLFKQVGCLISKALIAACPLRYTGLQQLPLSELSSGSVQHDIKFSCNACFVATWHYPGSMGYSDLVLSDLDPHSASCRSAVEEEMTMGGTL